MQDAIARFVPDGTAVSMNTAIEALIPFDDSGDGRGIQIPPPRGIKYRAGNRRESLGGPNGPPSLVAGLLTFPFVGEARAA